MYCRMLGVLVLKMKVALALEGSISKYDNSIFFPDITDLLNLHLGLISYSTV